MATKTGEILQAGQQLGRYRLVDMRGRGTNAVVWRVDTNDTMPTVSHAAKLSFGGRREFEAARAEAIRLSQIDSKHVVSLVDFREFLVLDAQSWERLGSPGTSSELLDQLAPWRDSIGVTDASTRRLHGYSARAVLPTVDVPDPPIVVPAASLSFDDDAVPIEETGLRGAALVQTLCRPTSLADHWLASGGVLSEAETVEIGFQVAEALRAVHDAPGHRPHLDVKLDNVFLLDDGQSWLLGDFGLGFARSRLDSAGSAPWFLALPDFWAHRASDIWMTGLLLHQLATGLLPLTFSGLPLRTVPDPFVDIAPELARRRAGRADGSGVWIDPRLSDELASLIEACLAVDHRARPSATELSERLRAIDQIPTASLAVGPYLGRDRGASVAADDAAWALGSACVADLKAIGIDVLDDRVDADSLLAAEPCAPCPSAEPTPTEGAVRDYGTPLTRSTPVGDVAVSPNRPRDRSALVGVGVIALLAVLAVVGSTWWSSKLDLEEADRADSAREAVTEPEPEAVTEPDPEAVAGPAAETGITAEAGFPATDLSPDLDLPPGLGIDTELIVTPSGSVPLPSEVSWAWFECGIVVTSRIDPLDESGSPSNGPLRTFFGNTSLQVGELTEGASACSGGTVNRSLYWTTALLDRRSGEPLPIISMHAGYTSARVPPAELEPIPTGAVYSLGNPAAQTASDTPGTIRWSCSDDSIVEQTAIPSCPDGAELVLEARFPQCWTGDQAALPSLDLVYADLVTICPSSHPVGIPALRIRIVYDLDGIAGPDDLVLGGEQRGEETTSEVGLQMVGGYGHGWDPDWFRHLLNHCLTKSLNCTTNELGAGVAVQPVR